MLKFTGAVLIFVSSIIILSRKVFECYFTYKFLDKAENIAEKLLYENSLNLPYDILLKKIGFEKISYLKTADRNRYIISSEIDMVFEFFNNLGKRNSEAEKQYITTGLSKIKRQKNIYLNIYNKNKRTYTLSGAAVGVFIIIILI